MRSPNDLDTGNRGLGGGVAEAVEQQERRADVDGAMLGYLDRPHDSIDPDLDVDVGLLGFDTRHDITVSLNGGADWTAPVAAASMTVATAPVVHSITPSHGPVGGGTPVTVSGHGFSGAAGAAGVGELPGRPIGRISISRKKRLWVMPIFPDFLGLRKNVNEDSTFRSDHGDMRSTQPMTVTVMNI